MVNTRGVDNNIRLLKLGNITTLQFQHKKLQSFVEERGTVEGEVPAVQATIYHDRSTNAYKQNRR